MPVKRSRIGRSSSSGATELLPPPPESAGDGGRGGWTELRAGAGAPRKRQSEASPRAPEKSSSPPRILTLSSPVKESVGPRGKEMVGDFLGRCYRCERQIDENAEVFMYGYLRAFCTVECRDMQIATDNAMEKASGSFQGMQLSPNQ